MDKKQVDRVNKDIEQARKAAHALLNSFHWNDSKEGGNYWFEVHQRLDQIGKDGIIK